MATISVHALVLKRFDSGESDRRLILLSRERGVLTASAKGARKAASRLAGSSEPLALAIFELAAGRANWFVTQSQPISNFPLLRSDYIRLTAGLALAELAAAVLNPGQNAEEEFDLLAAALRHLEVHANPITAFVWAQVRLLETAGSCPQFNRCVHSGKRVAEANAWFSPLAGGYVHADHADTATDRYLVRAEALLGLAALAAREEPPENLKFGEEAAKALLPLWRMIADRPLPANESFVREL